MTDSDLLSVGQVSKYLSLTERTIQRLSKQGKIKAIKLGGQWKFYKKDIEEYLLYGTDFSREPARRPDNFLERRIYPRINCSLPCYIRVIIPKKKEIYARGIILNIGEGGIFLENCDNDRLFLDIRNDDPIGLEFELDGRGRLNIDGRVLRTQDNGVAVKFRDISLEAREMICGYVG